MIESFRNAGTSLVVDEKHHCCRVLPGLASCILNPESLRTVPIREETEDEAAETDMELGPKECCELLYDLGAPDKKGQGHDNKETRASISIPHDELML
jgi:hypothetical protein